MKLINKIYLVTVAAVLLGGCSSERPNIDQHAKVVKETITTPTGKPSAPITMDYVISKNNLKVGDTFTIDLRFQAKSESAISVKAHSFEKLTVLNGQKSWQSNKLKSGKREAIPPIHLVATENGTFYVRLVASVVQNGNTLSKPFVIPVVVGDGVVHLQPVGEIITDSKGQKIIIQKGN